MITYIEECKRRVNLHRRCSRLNKIHKLTVDLAVYTNFIVFSGNNIMIDSI